MILVDTSVWIDFCIIAAICMDNDLTLLHKDRDFDAIEACAGLKVLKA